MKIKTIPSKYPDDLIHIDRWMCSKCGLIFDFPPENGPDELGWIGYEPPLEHVDFWIDEEGNYHLDEIEHREICPRCGVILNETPLVKIFVSPITGLDDIMPFIEQGEGTRIEFKVIFPKNAQELTNEIAAFATTAGGKIFLGVQNNGQIIGIQGIDTPTGKDDLQKRIRGLTGKIKPKVELYVDFVSEKDVHIAVITIPKGNMPFYTSDGKPYIRELDESRPAMPEEVTRLVKDWDNKKITTD